MHQTWDSSSGEGINLSYKRKLDKMNNMVFNKRIYGKEEEKMTWMSQTSTCKAMICRHVPKGVINKNTKGFKSSWRLEGSKCENSEEILVECLEYYCTRLRRFEIQSYCTTAWISVWLGLFDIQTRGGSLSWRLKGSKCKISEYTLVLILPGLRLDINDLGLGFEFSVTVQDCLPKESH